MDGPHKEIRRFIAKNEFEQALRCLDQMPSLSRKASNLKIQLHGRYSAYKQKRISGIFQATEQTAELNQLRQDFLDFLELTEAPTGPLKVSIWTFPFLAGLLVVMISGIYFITQVKSEKEILITGKVFL